MLARAKPTVSSKAQNEEIASVVSVNESSATRAPPVSQSAWMTMNSSTRMAPFHGWLRRMQNPAITKLAQCQAALGLELA